jgi:hypothetical protein
MFESKIDPPLRRKTAVLCSVGGACLFFAATYALFPLYAFYTTSTNKKSGLPPAPAGLASGFTMVANRGTISVLFALIGAFSGYAASSEIAKNTQRHRDLLNLIKKGKNLS